MPINYDEYLHASNGSGEAVRANVVVDRDIGSIEINVDSVLNWPNKFIATSGMIDSETGTFDPETVTVFFGHLNGTYIRIDEFAPGYSDIGNQQDEIVVLKPTTSWADKMYDAIDANKDTLYDLEYQPVYYIGTAPLGSNPADEVWNVDKVDLTTNPYTSKIALGISWNDRVGAIYE